MKKKEFGLVILVTNINILVKRIKTEIKPKFKLLIQSKPSFLLIL